MADRVNLGEIEELVTSDYLIDQSSPSRRYKPYALTAALKKMMEYVDPSDIQELRATRNFDFEKRVNSDVRESEVSHLMEGERIIRRSFEIDFDRATQGRFPWQAIEGVLGEPTTLYDITVRKAIIRFDDEEFEEEWTETIRKAIDADEVPTDWIETPFFAVLSSAPAGEPQARDRVQRIHDKDYFDEDAKADEKKPGLPMNLVTLDLEGIWSFRAFIDDDEVIRSNWKGDVDWTPRKIEYALMNYFNPQSRYSGLLRTSSLSNHWRRVFSTEASDIKVYEWEGEEEWEQQEDAEADF